MQQETAAKASTGAQLCEARSAVQRVEEELHNRVSEFTQALAAAHAEANALREQLGCESAARGAAEARVAQLDQQLAEVRMQNEWLEAAVADLQGGNTAATQLVRVQAEMRHLAESSEAAQSELRARVEELQGQVEAAQLQQAQLVQQLGESQQHAQQLVMQLELSQQQSGQQQEQQQQQQHATSGVSTAAEQQQQQQQHGGEGGPGAKQQSQWLQTLGLDDDDEDEAGNTSSSQGAGYRQQEYGDGGMAVPHDGGCSQRQGQACDAASSPAAAPRPPVSTAEAAVQTCSEEPAPAPAPAAGAWCWVSGHSAGS